MGAVTVSDLQGWQLFAYLPPADLARLANIASLHSCRAGETIFEEGEEAAAFWVLLRGKVKIHKIGAEAREQILRIVHPGESFGEAAALSGQSYPARGEAISRITIVRFPAAEYRRLLHDSPQLAANQIIALSQLLLGFASLVDALALRDVSARVAKYLLDLSAREGKRQVRLDTTKRALAARLGTVSEVLSRTFRRLQDQGIIAVEGPEIRVLDHTALERAAAGLRDRH